MATGNLFKGGNSVLLEPVEQTAENPSSTTNFKDKTIIWNRVAESWYKLVSGSWVVTTFSGSTPSFTDLTDVDTTGVSDGQAITFEASTSTWKPATIGSSGSASNLNALTDVTITGPQDNDVLYYDASTSQWRRQAFSTQETFSSNSDVLSVVRPYIDSVSGGSGFTDASGSVTLNLGSARAFHYTMTGNITSLSLANSPTGTQYETSFTLVLQIDATGGYTLGSPFPVTWLDGSSWDDLDLSANAVNIIQFANIGTTVYGAIVYKDGAIRLDSYVLSFADNGSQLVVVTQAETLDLANVSNVEADGTAGTGTLAFEKNGVSASGSTAFAAGDVLKVTLSGSTTPTAVSIPRSLG